MVHVANSDGQLHFLEEATVIDNLKKFTPDGEELLKQTLVAIKSAKDEKLSDILKSNDDLLKSATPEEKLNLLKMLFSVVNSDGKVQGEETEALRTLRVVLG